MTIPYNDHGNHPVTGEPGKPDTATFDLHVNDVAPDDLERWHDVAQQLLGTALDELATALQSNPDLLEELHSVSFVIRDDAPEDEPDLLGMYLGATNGGDPSMHLPPLVELYLLPLVDLATPEHLDHLAPDLTRLAEEIKITIRHELAHHLGMEHDRIDELGLS